MNAPTVDWDPTLSTLASVAVSLVSFSGLLTAFRTANAPLSRGDMVNIRILLIFSLGALVFALLPLPFGTATLESWTVLNLLMAGFLLLWPIRSPFWNRERGIAPRRPLLYYGVLAAETVLGLVLLITAIFGEASGGGYVLGVFWCLLVALVTFVAQVFSLLPVDAK